VKSFELPRLNREVENEAVYYTSEPEAVPEPNPRFNRETEPENVYYISEAVPEPSFPSEQMLDNL